MSVNFFHFIIKYVYIIYLIFQPVVWSLAGDPSAERLSYGESECMCRCLLNKCCIDTITWALKLCVGENVVDSCCRGPKLTYPFVIVLWLKNDTSIL